MLHVWVKTQHRNYQWRRRGKLNELQPRSHNFKTINFLALCVIIVVASQELHGKQARAAARASPPSSLCSANNQRGEILHILRIQPRSS